MSLKTESRFLSFRDYDLSENILQTTIQIGFKFPTDIQNQCIPLILKGRDVIGEAKTGSGKTAAFGLPIIQKLANNDSKKPLQALILTPTRELCLQVTKHLQKFAKSTRIRVASIHGGVSYSPQFAAIESYEIIVATTGRFMDIMRKKKIPFKNLDFIVVDEADRMFDMGFRPDIEFIMDKLPQRRQTLLFSATIPAKMLQFFKPYQRNRPKIVRVDSQLSSDVLEQNYYVAKDQQMKFDLLMHQLISLKDKKTIVFCRTRSNVKKLVPRLENKGFRNVSMLHGLMSQTKRSNSIYNFTSGKSKILVATDVASRGLDIENVETIVIYSVPETKDDYIHRIGRTARAGAHGQVWVILTKPEMKKFSESLKIDMMKLQRRAKPNPDELKKEINTFIKLNEYKIENDDDSSDHNSFKKNSNHKNNSQKYRNRLRNKKQRSNVKEKRKTNRSFKKHF